MFFMRVGLALKRAVLWSLKGPLQLLGQSTAYVGQQQLVPFCCKVDPIAQQVLQHDVAVDDAAHTQINQEPSHSGVDPAAGALHAVAAGGLLGPPTPPREDVGEHQAREPQPPWCPPSSSASAPASPGHGSWCCCRRGVWGESPACRRSPPAAPAGTGAGPPTADLLSRTTTACRPAQCPLPSAGSQGWSAAERWWSSPRSTHLDVNPWWKTTCAANPLIYIPWWRCQPAE